MVVAPNSASAVAAGSTTPVALMRDLRTPRKSSSTFWPNHTRIACAQLSHSFRLKRLKTIPLLEYHTLFNGRIVKKANCDSGQHDHNNTFGTRLDLSLSRTRTARSGTRGFDTRNYKHIASLKSCKHGVANTSSGVHRQPKERRWAQRNRRAHSTNPKPCCPSLLRYPANSRYTGTGNGR